MKFDISNLHNILEEAEEKVDTKHNDETSANLDNTLGDNDLLKIFDDICPITGNVYAAMKNAAKDPKNLKITLVKSGNGEDPKMFIEATEFATFCEACGCNEGEAAEEIFDAYKEEIPGERCELHVVFPSDSLNKNVLGNEKLGRNVDNSWAMQLMQGCRRYGIHCNTNEQCGSKNDSLSESLDSFFDNNKRIIDETFNELNYNDIIMEAEEGTGKRGFFGKIAEIASKAWEMLKKIYAWIKKQFATIGTKIKEYVQKFKNRKKKAPAGGNKLPGRGPAAALPEGQPTRREKALSKLDNNSSKGNGVINQNPPDYPKLEAPVDVDEIINLMKKTGFNPKMNAFVYSPDLTNSIDRYIDDVAKGKTESFYKDLISRDKYDNGRSYNGWNGKFYNRSASSMVADIVKKYYSNEITNKYEYYTDTHVDPYDSSELEETYNYIKSSIDKSLYFAKKRLNRPDDLSGNGVQDTREDKEYFNEYRNKCRAATQVYNELSKFQAQNMQAYYQFVQAIPMFADKVRANRNKKED